jgi:hypothetical protein
MGIPQRLGTIPLAIFTDASNNIGIGGSPSGTYKFEVTGTGRFTGSLTGAGATFSSTINAAGAGANIRLSGATTDGGLVVSASKFYIGDFATLTKGLVIDMSSGNVGIGTSSPATPLSVATPTGSSETIRLICADAIGDGYISWYRSTNVRKSFLGYGGSNDDNFYIAQEENAPTIFMTNGAERMRITSDGDFLVGTTTNSGFTTAHRIKGPSATENAEILSIDGGVEYSGFFRSISGANYNGAACGMQIGRNTSTLRSINAGGTINASGADYAEYMLKAIEDTIAKGDIVGVNAEGKLTNIFDDSISFVVKSTDPSYVGGDTWGNSDSIGEQPRIQEGQSDEEYEQLKAEYEIKLEEARAKVDRIAFSGQVPCNVLNANVGDYIIPIKQSNGKIAGQAVKNPTFEQYQISVGKVWKIMEDGRAWIAVKIG